MFLTFQYVDSRAIIALLDDTASLCKGGGIHAVHDGEDLAGFYVLHEIVFQQSLLDQMSRSAMISEGSKEIKQPVACLKL